MKNSLQQMITIAVVLAATGALAGETRMAHVYNATLEELGAPAERTYFSTDVADGRVQELRQQLITAGARNIAIFGGLVLVADLPKTKDFGPVLSSPEFAGFARNTEEEIPDYAPGAGPSLLSQVKEAYRVAEVLGSPDVPRMQPGVDFDEVVREVSREDVRRIQKKIMDGPALSSAGPGGIQRALNQNSEILTGSIRAYLIFPESNGQADAKTETWYEPDGVTENQDLLDARTHAFAAMLDWMSQFAGMGLDIDIKWIITACAYEPINYVMATDDLWILDSLHRIDPSLAHLDEPLAACHAFNEERRGGYDWIFTMFIGHSRNVQTHKFGNGNAPYTAYANLGGPYLVNPYPAGIDRGIGENLQYSQVISHESGHIFWTLDEYPGAPGTCASTSGYLNYANMNINYTTPGGISRCIDEIDCIMNRAPWEDLGRPWCKWSKGMLGVIKEEGDPAVPDVFEAPPRIDFEVAEPETVNTNDFTVRLTGVSQAVPNQNRAFGPEERVDYAAPLKEGQFSVGGGWKTLSAADGNWNEMEEDASIRIQGLPPGETKLKFRVRNGVGLYSPEYVKTIYFLGVSYTRLNVAPRPVGNRISWEVIGEDFGAQFNVYRVGPDEYLPNLRAIAPGEDLPGTLIKQNVEPVQDGSGFVLYAVEDRDVDPGVEYRYYVNAEGEVEFEGVIRAFYSPSNVVSQTAMVPVPAGRSVSYASPNPFTNHVSFSINVPPTFVQASTQGPSQGSSFERRVATPVEVVVYDVRGRPVRTLHNDTAFDDVLTLSWDGTNSVGTSVAAGVYFIRIRAGEMRAVEKVLLIR